MTMAGTRGGSGDASARGTTTDAPPARAGSSTASSGPQSLVTVTVVVARLALLARSTHSTSMV